MKPNQLDNQRYFECYTTKQITIEYSHVFLAANEDEAEEKFLVWLEDNDQEGTVKDEEAGELIVDEVGPMEYIVQANELLEDE